MSLNIENQAFLDRNLYTLDFARFASGEVFSLVVMALWLKYHLLSLLAYLLFVKC